MVAVSLASLATPTLANGRHQDRVYADSFGNLVIDSAAGYKRIIVGEGKLAKKLADYTSAGQPKVIYQNESDEISGYSDCYRPPVFVKGRSYMAEIVVDALEMIEIGDDQRDRHALPHARAHR